VAICVEFLSKEKDKGMKDRGMKTRSCATFMGAKRWSGGFSRCRLARDHPAENMEFNGGTAFRDLRSSAIGDSHPCQSVKAKRICGHLC